MEEVKIGHNNPPKSIEDEIQELFEEAKNFLDGEEITTEAMASEVTKLKNMLTSTKTKAEKERKALKQPIIDKGGEIEEKYKSLKEKVDMAVGLCRDALKPYLLEQQRIQEEKAAQLRKEAEEKERAAKEEVEKLNTDILEDLERSAELNKEKEKLLKKAKAAENKKSNASSSFGRAAGIKIVKEAVVVDYKLAIAYFWKTEEGREAFINVANSLAKKNINKEIPGVEVRERKEVT